MEFTKLLHDLRFPSEVVRILEGRRHLFSEYREFIMGMTEGDSSASSYKALDQVMGEDDMGMLACQLFAAAHTREKYRSQGIDDRIFLDTMGCFRRFLIETERRTGKLCFDRGWWTYRQLGMRLFRIGQLEYEMMQQPHAVAMHIPSDSSITTEAVDASVAGAKAFIAQYFPDYADAPFGCESWLLSPALREHLDPDSRILAFQDRFALIHIDPESKDVWEWLFRSPYEVPVEELPETTSLQRKVKKYMLAGGSIGVARGILK